MPTILQTGLTGFIRSMQVHRGRVIGGWIQQDGNWPNYQSPEYAILPDDGRRQFAANLSSFPEDLSGGQRVRFDIAQGRFTNYATNITPL